jgi:hypothetical protein
MQQDLQKLRDVESEIQKLRELIEKSQEAREPEPAAAAAPEEEGALPLWSWGLVGFLGLAVGAVLAFAWASRRSREG